MKLKVAVIGSGSAGASSALLLNKQGHDVTVFEREKEPKPVGAGIMLQVPGLKILSEFGVMDKAIASGTKLYGMQGWDEKGKTVVDLDFEDKNSLFGLGIHRSALYFLLFDKLKEASIDVQLGVEIIGFEGEEKKTLIDAKGEKHVGFDLVVVANGARSALRQNLGIVKHERVQKYAAIWSKIPQDNSIFDNKIHQFYEGSHTMLGFMPIGKIDESSEEFVNFFWSIKFSAIEQWKKDGITAWKQKIRNLTPQFYDVVDKITSYDQLMVAPYMDVELKPCYKDNIVFIGDAAHPMSPQLSQGASLALLDSKDLSGAIAQFDGDVSKALPYFYKKRYKQVLHYQKLSRWITPMFQSDRKNTWFRDNLFKLACSVKPSQNMLRSTILGYRKNYVANLDKEYYLGLIDEK